jgi:hypothetical protein
MNRDSSWMACALLAALSATAGAQTGPSEQNPSGALGPYGEIRPSPAGPSIGQGAPGGMGSHSGMMGMQPGMGMQGMQPQGGMGPHGGMGQTAKP